jgi:hypothetical protein
VSLKRRLESLEGRAGTSPEEVGWRERYEWMKRHYFPVLENARREMEGLEPLSVPEEEADPELDDRLEAYFEGLER